MAGGVAAYFCTVCRGMSCERLIWHLRTEGRGGLSEGESSSSARFDVLEGMYFLTSALHYKTVALLPTSKSEAA
jgi:hypothetical protein